MKLVTEDNLNENGVASDGCGPISSFGCFGWELPPGSVFILFVCDYSSPHEVPKDSLE